MRIVRVCDVIDDVTIKKKNCFWHNLLCWLEIVTKLNYFPILQPFNMVAKYGLRQSLKPKVKPNRGWYSNITIQFWFHLDTPKSASAMAILVSKSPSNPVTLNFDLRSWKYHFLTSSLFIYNPVGGISLALHNLQSSFRFWVHLKLLCTTHGFWKF